PRPCPPAPAGRGALRQALGEAAAAHLHELAWGRDPRPVVPERAERSIGAETTFADDVADPEALRRVLLALADKVAVRLRRAGQAGRTVSIKVRLADFRTVHRARTLDHPTDVGREIFETAWSLFRLLRSGADGRAAGAAARGAGGPAPVDRALAEDRIRLLGVRVEGLGESGPAARQLALGEPARGWRDAEAAADAAAVRFGRSVIRPASLLDRPADSRAENPARPSVVPLSDPRAPS
ncbi:MAG TPA: hypothetical protein VNV66_00805, partial [Pilimelia sp.]|nr:hypothetical protein [Pilimelia sp.]